MRQIKISGAALCAPIFIAADNDEPFLDIVRRLHLPLYWRCGHGTCGACAIKIRHGAQPCDVLLSKKERNVLIRHGFLQKSAVQSEVFQDTSDFWRLACYLKPCDFPDPLELILPAGD